MTTAVQHSMRALPQDKDQDVDAATIRRAMGRVPTSVAVVTALCDGGEPVGMTIGSLTSVSLDPPLVAFFAFSGSSTFAQLRRSECFCINVLAEDQAEICHGFARIDGAKFEVGEWEYHHGIPHHQGRSDHDPVRTGPCFRSRRPSRHDRPRHPRRLQRQPAPGVLPRTNFPIARERHTGLNNPSVRRPLPAVIEDDFWYDAHTL